MTVPFDPLYALRVLQRHNVEFLIIGGLAGRLWGSPTMTNDLDICYRRTPGNLEPLAAALGELDARLRGVDDDVPFTPDTATLSAGGDFTFITSAGFLDILAVPAGTEGFDTLERTAQQVALGELTVGVASLLDLIRMKRAAGRPKDLIEIEVLAAVQDERESIAGDS